MPSSNGRRALGGAPLVAACVAAAILAGRAAGQEAGAEAEPPAAETGSAAETRKDGAPGFFTDPTMGGTLHLSYRAVYQAAFYRYHPYRFFFQDVNADDLRAAAELEARHRNKRTDQDLDQYLSFRTQDLFLPRWEARYLTGVDTDVSFRYFQDLDGSPTGDEAQSTYDFAGANNLQLRTLNARLKLLDNHLEVTGGRMYIDGAEWVHLDGGLARARGLAFLGRPFEIEAFAGAQVSYFRTVDQTTVVGGALRIWPWRDGRLELADVYFLANTLRASFEQKLGEAWRASADYRQIDHSPQAARFQLSGDWPATGVSVWMEYFGKLSVHRQDFIYDFTTLLQASAHDRAVFRYLNLGNLEPFDEASLEARWQSPWPVGFLLGGTAHFLRGGSPADEFNHDWFETWGGVDTSHFPWDGLSSRAVVRYLNTRLPRREPAFSDPFLVSDVRADGEPSFVGLELLLEQDFARRLTVGATLEVRRYDYDSRFARLSNLWGMGATAYARYRQNRFLSYGVTYAYDRDYRFINPDLEDVHAIRVEALLGF